MDRPKCSIEGCKNLAKKNCLTWIDAKVISVLEKVIHICLCVIHIQTKEYMVLINVSYVDGIRQDVISID